MKLLPEYKLMIPGPRGIDDDIIQVMGRPLAAHYGPEWAILYRETIQLMQRVFCTKNDVLFLFNSGMGGLEAALSSLFARGDQILIINNGFFGQRLTKLAEAVGLEPVSVTAEWGQPISLDAIRQTLTENRAIKGIFAVHHDTGTGMLNPIKEIGAIGKEFNLPLLVDAVSSAGGDPLYVDEWGIDVCVTAGNKALGAPVGWAAVSVSDRAWEIIEAQENKAAGWYLNLSTWRNAIVEEGDWHPSPVTVSSHTLEAFHLALTKICDEGLENRWQRYKETAEWFRAAMKERGFSCFIEGENASSVITALYRPDFIDGADFASTLYRKHKIQIAFGLGPMKDQIFRIGHLGHARENIVAFLAAVDDYLENK